MIRGIRILARGQSRAVSIVPYGRRCICSGAVMSFGDGSHGAIGLPTSITGIGGAAYEPITVPGLPPDVTSVAAGHYHSLAVDSQGHLWAWGRDHEAQLGRGFASPRDSWNVPKRVIGLDLVNVRSASASGVVSAAIGDDGSLWIWGKSKRGQLGLGKDVMEAVRPSRVQALEGEKIVKVSFGWGHALACSEDGKLFGWGYYADGRLGNVGRTLKMSPLDSSSCTSTNGQKLQKIELAERLVLESMKDEKNMPIIWEPHFVEDLTGVEVVDIACGLDHSLVLCRDGTLLSCGSNIYGQLGRARQDLGLLPVDTSFHVKSVAAGLGHSLALCQDTSNREIRDVVSVISWGWNQTPQLGREGPNSIPLAIEELAGEIPVSVSGGRAHSIVLGSRGEVWVWGCGKDGRLGLGSSSDESEPIFLDSLENCNVVQAVSGFDHNLVLVAD
ncbi:secretion-regulating guanine nucleotide exchange factor [Momordica charantia]|uniref:Secretion-regulating guanine nucleotide exchange factor n=1 Tax=Momordica charantia TaxID=3673 RepID=A0A6J1C6L5_MOMCH|nr:secretion-regulating guanine nucleotide exchange factor [Momordica charantia]